MRNRFTRCLSARSCASVSEPGGRWPGQTGDERRRVGRNCAPFIAFLAMSGRYAAKIGSENRGQKTGNIPSVPGFPQTLNLYGYMHNNPLSGVDADGHVDWGALWQAGKEMVGALSAKVGLGVGLKATGGSKNG